MMHLTVSTHRSYGKPRLTSELVLTALFSTCGMTLPTFLIASVSSLPNQFVSVYLGYAARLAAEGCEYHHFLF
jgi:uncharacterized membrane protein YdjX (TVP38/TMEM64 family)